jgi:ATP-dependent DNA ligase
MGPPIFFLASVRLGQHSSVSVPDKLRSRKCDVLSSPQMLPGNLRPIRLSRRIEPFDSDQFIFELKVDGFRALAHIEAGEGRLVSRNGNTLRGFADLAAWLAEHLRVESAVLHGEIACVDDGGRPVFRDLLFRRRQCVSTALT